MIFICLRLIYCIIYEPFCSIIFFHLLGNLLCPFSKIIKIYLQNILRSAFLFRLQIGMVYHGENFLITVTNNTQIEQDLGSIEYAVEHSESNCNRFFLQLMQHAVLHCHNDLISSILIVFLLWHFNLSS